MDPGALFLNLWPNWGEKVNSTEKLHISLSK